jgi:hypothetical protein
MDSRVCPLSGQPSAFQQRCLVPPCLRPRLDRVRCWREPPRVVLKREVSTAAAGAGSELEFFARLGQAGVLVRLRYSTINPAQVTGYAVALAADTTKAGGPVWYSGGKLAADLTLPKLRHRWATTTLGGAATPRGGLTAGERTEIWDHAGQACDTAAQQIRALARTDPAGAADAAWAASDTLHAAASALGSPFLRQAAAAYDRAARVPYGRLPRPSRAGCDLRRAARLLSAAAFTSHDRHLAHLALMLRLAALADAVADLRTAQAHTSQATAARAAAERLHAATPNADSPQVRGLAPVPAATMLAGAAFPAMPGQGQAGQAPPRHAATPRHGRAPRQRPGPAP